MCKATIVITRWLILKVLGGIISTIIIWRCDMTNLGNEWDQLLAAETESDYMNELREFLREEYRTGRIYPPKRDMFRALKLTSYSDVKVVIIGQDPYHGAGQAMGMCFSVRDGVKIPPSLVNIYKEIERSTGRKQPESGDLTRWAQQGVLLLNAVLTVREGQAGSHRGRGWERFTDYIVSLLNKREKPIVFLLWGADAKKAQRLITNPRHTVLTAAHPSPLSAYNGFFGCDHFNLANAAIIKNGMMPIEW